MSSPPHSLSMGAALLSNTQTKGVFSLPCLIINELHDASSETFVQKMAPSFLYHGSHWLKK